MRLVSFLLVACLAPFALVTAADPAPSLDQVQPAASPAFSAKLTGAAADGILQFTLPGQAEPRSLSVRDLVRWGEWRKVQPGSQVQLHDGSFVIADILAVTPDHLTADSINGLGEFKLPRETVRALVLQPARWKPQALAQAPDPNPPRGHTLPVGQGVLPAAAGSPSELILANGDRRAGSLAGWDADALRWQTGEQTFKVPLTNVVAVEFRQPVSGNSPEERSPEKSKKLQTWLGFTDGSRVLASSFTRDKNGWQIQLAAGGIITAEPDLLVALQTLHGRAVYLSDLLPAGYKSIPWLTTTWDYTRDRNVTGGELRVRDSLALKGLGMHSASRLTYDLGKHYDRFAARVGIDDSTHGRGHALARVYGDRGDGKWELLHETPPLDGGAAPVAIDLEVRDLQRLALVVDFAGDGDAGDHVDWLDARLIRKPE